MFGDRLHLRIYPGTSRVVIRHLKEAASAHKAKITLLQTITPQLEDVFIDLLEKQQKVQIQEGAK